MAATFAEQEVIDAGGTVDSDDGDDEGVSELIRRIGNRSILTDPRHPDHKNKNLLDKNWREVAFDLQIDLGSGVAVTGTTCKAKWKKLRDYYYRKKKAYKGKSGDGRSKKKTWAHYKQIDAILSRCPHENLDTQSNLMEDDQSTEMSTDTANPSETNVESNATTGQLSNGSNDNASTESSTQIPTATSSSRMTTTPTNSDSSFRLSKKRRTQSDVTTEQLMQIIQATGKEEDEFFRYGMSIAAKLRGLPKKKSSKAQLKISALLHKIEFISDSDSE